MAAKKSTANAAESQVSGTGNADYRMLVHLQQASDLAEELLSDLAKFRAIDQSGGRNDESLEDVDTALHQFCDQSRNLRSTILTSQIVYVDVKNLYMTMQDAKIYFGQAIKKPSTSAKDSFIGPFGLIADNMHEGMHRLQQSVTKEIEAINSPNAQISVEVYQLGVSHMFGLDGRPMNYTIAVQYFEHAASNGNTEAMAMLSKCYLHGHGVEQNEGKGMEWLVQAANSKVCPHAKNELAMLIITNLKDRYPACVRDYCAKLLEGETNTSRHSRANNSTGTAGAAGDAGAEARGESYGVEDAIKLLLDAASDGCVDAKSNLGSVYEEAGDLEQAAMWYNQASEEGCARGAYLLGHLFLKGKLSANKAHTFALLQQAAKSGQMEALYCLGTCYEQGVGVEISIDLAVQYYRRGAKLGSKLGMYSLGYLLVQNAIEMRQRLKQRRPYSSDRSHVTTSVVVESNAEDEQYAELVEEAEGMLQEGIHWLRAASENHMKDAAFQLGRLYEQAIGVPNDGFAALANYKWAAQLGHPRAAFYAGNLLYAHTHARGRLSQSEAAEYYQQAALGGIVEAMNSYALLLEDGRASDAGTKDPHLAAAWFYQACVERDRLEKAFLNLAMLIFNTPLSSFRTIPGDIVTLPDLKDFLLDFFESDAFAHDERRDAVLEMVDNINEHNPAALPLVEEVSLSLSATRGVRSPGREQRGHTAGTGRTAPPRPPKGSATAGAGVSTSAPNAVTLGSDDGETVVVERIPTSQAGAHSQYTTAQRANRVHEEVHKLSRGPIQNQGFSSNFVRGHAEERLVPPRSTSPPVHAQNHRSGELYSTDGPVIPPSFVPRAIQSNAPVFKPDKPLPPPKPDQVPPSYLNNAATSASSAPPVPVLSSPTRKVHLGSAEVQAEKPPAVPPRPPKLKDAVVAAMVSTPAAQRPVSAPASTHAAGAAGVAAPAERSESRERAPKSGTRRLSFISGLVKMLSSTGGGGSEDHNEHAREHPDAHGGPSEEGKTANEVPFQQQSSGAHAGELQTRKSVDSIPAKRSSSVWKSIKHAAHLGPSTSKSVDFSTGQPGHSDQSSSPAPNAELSPSPAVRSTARSTSAPRGTQDGEATAGTRHSAPNNYFSAGASVKRPAVGAGSGPQRSASASSAVTAIAAPAGQQNTRSHSAAQGVFASEPQPVASPAKPAKPPYVTSNSAQLQNRNQNQSGEAARDQNAGQAGQPLQQPSQQPLGILSMEMPDEDPSSPAGPAAETQAAVVEQFSAGAGSATSVGSGKRDTSPPKHNSIMTRFMQAKHKKYLGKSEPANVNPAAASSTGTIESVEAEEPATPVQVPAGAGVGKAQVQSGPSPATPFIQSNSLSRSNIAQSKPNQSEVTEFDDSEELVRSFDKGDVSGNEFFEPVSDLSMSSRDIR